VKKEKLSLLYDISVLGMGQFSCTARTGVFRLTENLLMQAINDPNTYRINWVASRANYFQCHEYLKSHGWNFNNHRSPYPQYPYFCDKQAARFSKFRPLRILFKTSQNLFHSSASRFIQTKAQDIDIYHSNYFAIPKSLIENKKIIKFLTIYDMIPFLYPHFFTGRIIHQVKKAIDSLSPSDFVICISESTRADFLNLVKFDSSRVFVIPLGTSDSFNHFIKATQVERVKRKYKIPEGQYILSVATLEPRKNLKQLINAFQTVVEQEKLDNLHLVLIGAKGPHYKKLYKEINMPSRLRDRIIFTGYIPDRDLCPLYSGALVFVYLSFYEGFGLPPLEAMKCGAPVITSNTSSLPEVVGDAGILISPYDLDDICHNIINIYRNEALRNQLSSQSLQQAKKFSWKKCFQQTHAAYKKALEMN